MSCVQKAPAHALHARPDELARRARVIACIPGHFAARRRSTLDARLRSVDTAEPASVRRRRTGVAACAPSVRFSVSKSLRGLAS